MDYGFFGLEVIMILMYLAAIGFVVFWLIKMLKNSDEQVKLNREILNLLKKKNDQDNT